MSDGNIVLADRSTRKKNWDVGMRLSVEMIAFIHISISAVQIISLSVSVFAYICMYVCGEKVS